MPWPASQLSCNMGLPVCCCSPVEHVVWFFVQFVPGPGNHAITVHNVYSLYHRWGDVVLTTQPVVARQLPTPARPLVLTSAKKTSPLVQAVRTQDELRVSDQQCQPFGLQGLSSAVYRPWFRAYWIFQCPECPAGGSSSCGGCKGPCSVDVPRSGCWHLSTTIAAMDVSHQAPAVALLKHGFLDVAAFMQHTLCLSPHPTPP